MFTTTFCCCSHKCLYGEAGATALNDGTVNGMPCRGEIATRLGESFLIFCLIIAL